MNIYERQEIDELKKRGHHIDNPAKVVDLFEETLAKYCGAPYAIAVDCATHALMLCLKYLKAQGKVQVPAHTYPSFPMAAHHCGLEIEWTEEQWEGSYQLHPLPIIDASLWLAPEMYRPGLFYCLSFQHKKRIGIGRGGMILTDDLKAYQWMKKACHDGRTPHLFWHDDQIDTLGWHYYMTPDDAARGLLLFEGIQKGDLPDRGENLGGWQNYPDLRTFPVFQNLESS